MPPGQADATRQPATITPLGGVRADFVANLGRRMTELRQHWTAFEQEPGTARYRDEVRRRIHALATRARLLEFPVMADPLEEAERRLDRLAEATTIAPEEIGWFHDLFRNLPSMAWTEAGAETPASLAVPDYHRSVAPPPPPPSSPTPAPSPLPAAPAEATRAPSQAPAAPARAPSQAPAAPLSPGTLASVLVVGSDKTSRALLEGHGSAGVSLETERTDDVSVALDLARALAPDLIVVDFDVEGAGALVTALSEDPLTEGLPVIAIGSWTHPDQGADLLHLGLVRALPKPVPPDTLRAAAEQALSQGRGIHPPLEPLGEMTVEQVADRLASQLRAGLVQAVRPESRRVKIPLGDGTDALAAVWGAVARLRETLTIRSKGEVRFSSDGPAGAVPLASWLDDGVEAPPRRRDGSSTREAERVRLEGRKIVVVDDDPAVTWFLSGLLRNAGAFVYEAHDGRRAFEIACRAQPDLVVSDIVMPELDGFGLCRVLKRDIALRDTPVILLSWKEDMLQRVRELGARADGYLRKESPVPAILRRVHEVLLPRLRIETRLRGSGEVRGRLDGLTGKTLLQLVCSNTPDCRLELRDALHVFSLDVRGGSPVTASRTEHDGSFERGHPALVALLGLTSGRFHVRACTDTIRPNLQGDLASILLPFIARARAAQALLSAERLADVLSVQLSDTLPLESMPDSARTVLAAIRQGASPYDLVAVHRTPAAVVEAILDDAAIRGAIDRIVDVSGHELLEAETARQIELFKTTDKRVSRSPSAASSGRSAARAAPPPPPEPEPVPVPVPVPVPAPEPAPLPEPNPFASLVLSDLPPPPAPEPVAEAPRLAPSAPQADEDDDGQAPTSLTEAVIREVLDPKERRLPSPMPPPMLDARDLKPRSRRLDAAPVPSLPPDAIVPAPVPTFPPVAEPVAPHLIEGSESAAEPMPEPAPLPEPEVLPREPQPPRVHRGGARAPARPISYRPPPPQTARRGRLALLALVVAVVAGLVWWNFARHAEESKRVGVSFPPPSTSAPPASSPARNEPLPAVSQEPTALPPSAASADPVDPRAKVEDLPLPQGSRLPPDSGLVEVRTHRAEAVILLEGREIGAGHHVQVAAAEGERNLVIRWKGDAVTLRVEVKGDRRTRVTLEPP